MSAGMAYVNGFPDGRGRPFPFARHRRVGRVGRDELNASLIFEIGIIGIAVEQRTCRQRQYLCLYGGGYRTGDSTRIGKFRGKGFRQQIGHRFVDKFHNIVCHIVHRLPEYPHLVRRSANGQILAYNRNRPVQFHQIGMKIGFQYLCFGLPLFALIL